MTATLVSFNKTIDSAGKTLKKPIVKSFVNVILILYAANFAPRLPSKISMYLENVFVKIFLISIIIWLQDVSPSTSLLMSIGFVLSTNYLSGRQLLEGFRIEQNTNIPDNCKNVKLSDLLGMFNGDTEQLKAAMLNAQVPFNIPPNEENAPRIATNLMNYGYNMNGLCELPKSD